MPAGMLCVCVKIRARRMGMLSALHACSHVHRAVVIAVWVAVALCVQISAC